MVLSPEALHAGWRIYEVFEPTHLGELKGCERNSQRKKTKNKRPRRKKLKDVETFRIRTCIDP